MSYLVGKYKDPIGLFGKPSGQKDVNVQPPPGEPTIDDAAKNRDQLDRIRRRRGVLANIYTDGAGAASPGTKTTLG